MKDIPLSSSEAFDAWLQKIWAEKDALMEQYLTTGRFPGNAEETGGIAFTGERKEKYVETEVRLERWWEVGKTFTILLAFAGITNLGAKMWNRVVHGV